MGSRHEMKNRVRIGVVPDDKAVATIVCSGCMELKTPNQMNHRLRKTGEVTITDKFQKMVVSSKPTKTDEASEDPMDTPKDNSSEKVLEESNEIQLTIPRFGVDNALGDIPSPLPAQHMFACFIGPPRSGKTSLSTALLTQTAPKVYNGVFDHVFLFVPATSFASMSDSPFRNHDKVSHELDKATLEAVIVKLEAASKKKENSLIIIDDFMASLKENTLKSALEKLISNRRHLRISGML
ncbi:hypothetical protein T492DRAFT_849684 [Pavlovales sp. CCMP2436]|nr:hypothetical protein T492DRAFT_849684 [Pavlovales sp. CCMP2436]